VEGAQKAMVTAQRPPGSHLQLALQGVVEQNSNVQLATPLCCTSMQLLALHAQQLE
jgi:hypothetical protein